MVLKGEKKASQNSSGNSETVNHISIFDDSRCGLSGGVSLTRIGWSNLEIVDQVKFDAGYKFWIYLSCYFDKRIIVMFLLLFVQISSITLER